ncbi:Arv1-like protein [Prunus dulcis]|uniref:Arv1-like protein n=1 Tax=Prunus dulcis TaxID=3755 RepID=A0A5H2Y392_PRUDU|nr:Arv1-like protein [Prunus dulcis]
MCRVRGSHDDSVRPILTWQHSAHEMLLLLPQNLGNCKAVADEYIECEPIVWECPSVIFIIDLFVLSSNTVALKVITQAAMSRCIAACFSAHVNGSTFPP